MRDNGAVNGSYDLTGVGREGKRYDGSLDIRNDGQACSLTWRLRNDQTELALSGSGFVIDDLLVAGRSLSNDQTQPPVGVVVYDISKRGTLPAKWYHADLEGQPGKGLSTGGPLDSLEGVYVAEYGSQEQEFAPLRKQLSIRGSGFHFRWLQGDETIYVGTGFVIGEKLFCSWGTPRQHIDVLVYQRSENGGLHGKWFDLSGPIADRFGNETATARH